jgi:hypothetical protein
VRFLGRICSYAAFALRTTGVGRCGGEARRARRVPQRSPGKGRRRRGRGPTASLGWMEAAAVRAPLDVYKPPPPKKELIARTRRGSGGSSLQHRTSTTSTAFATRTAASTTTSTTRTATGSTSDRRRATPPPPPDVLALLMYISPSPPKRRKRPASSGGSRLWRSLWAWRAVQHTHSKCGSHPLVTGGPAEQTAWPRATPFERWPRASRGAGKVGEE